MKDKIIFLNILIKLHILDQIVTNSFISYIYIPCVHDISYLIIILKIIRI